MWGMGTGSWAGPLLTILKVSLSRPLAWHTSESLAGMVPELPSKQGPSVPWEEAGAGVSWGAWATAPEGQCWATTGPDASQSPSPFSQ